MQLAAPEKVVLSTRWYTWVRDLLVKTKTKQILNFTKRNNLKAVCQQLVLERNFHQSKYYLADFFPFECQKTIFKSKQQVTGHLIWQKCHFAYNKKDKHSLGILLKTKLVLRLMVVPIDGLFMARVA